MSSDLCHTSAAELAVRIRNGSLSPVEVIEAHLDRIASVNDQINAYTTVFEEEARGQAREAERAREAGEELGPLHGVPIAIKDLGYLIEGRTVTNGAVPLADSIADRDTVAVSRLKEAGAIILGQTNTPEFGYKGTTDNLLFGPTSTPFAPGRNAGGSSGGSAAATAAGLAPIGMGGDGGGSVRIPASFSGAYGIKPTFGRIPRDARPNGFARHTPFADPGPITRTVVDAALVLDVVGRASTRDPFALPDDGTDYLAATRRSIEGLSVAYTPNFDVFPVSEAVGRIIDDSVEAFEEAGAIVEEVELGISASHQELTDLWLDFAGVSFAGIAKVMKRHSNVDLLGDHRDDLPADFVDIIERGNALSAAEYKYRDVLRTDVYDVLDDCLGEYDLIASPTLAVPPVENAEDGTTVGPSTVDGVSVDPRLGWCLTHPINFTGHPAASLPAGFTEDGLPIGLQLVGRQFDDETVLAASAAFERVRPWHDRYPAL